MQEYTLEVCIDSLESARNAIAGGANRLELCAGLAMGGLTPSPALFQQIRRESDIKIHVMLRPRGGDFLYTDAEMEQMCDEARMYRSLGADGIAAGILTAEGALDVPRMKLLKEAIGCDMLFTLHRAYDLTCDPLQALADARACGVTAVLTSGQQPTVSLGLPLIKTLVSSAEGLSIIPGAGLNARNITMIRSETGASAFHLSGSVIKDSLMRFRRGHISMGHPGLDEFTRCVCDRDKIAAVKEILEAIA